MKYAHIDKETQQILGWYSEEDHCTYIPAISVVDEEGHVSSKNNIVKDGYYDLSRIPTPYIEVTEEQWEIAKNNHHNTVLSDGTTKYVKPIKKLNESKAIKLSTIKTDYVNTVKLMTGNSDPAEIASWTKQEQEARAWMADNAVVTPIIDNLIIGRAAHESKADLVAKIIIKADSYAVAYAQLLGAYHAQQKAIEAATTVAEVEAV